MKILLIHDTGTATGGAELQILSLRQGLRDLGHDVRLFSSVATPVEGSEILAEYSCFGTNSLFQVISQTANVSAYRQLQKILREFKPDVVHVRMFLWQMSPLILPLLKKYPCIYQTAVYKAICPSGTKMLPDGSTCQVQPGMACLSNKCLTNQTWILLMLQRKLWLTWRDAIDVVVALSSAMKIQLEAGGIQPVEVIYNGVAIKSESRSLCLIPTVVYAGRLVAEKGIDILLRAFASVRMQIPQAHLLIAGSGKEEKNLQALSRQLNIDSAVEWLGYLPQVEMEQRFEGAWVQAVPSQWAEPFGNVTTEAMMRGTAVIASAVGAQSEIVVDGATGFLIGDYSNVNRWVSSLISLLSNRELAQDMGKAGRDRALAKFSEQERNLKFVELYQRLRHIYNSSSSKLIASSQI